MIRRADMGGQLSVATETTSLYANSRVCRKSSLSTKSTTYEKLSLEEALALELPPELLEGFPSPFQEGTQWSGDLATEVIGAAQTTGAPEDTSEPDRR